jgi:hypothetical protein
MWTSKETNDSDQREEQKEIGEKTAEGWFIDV